MDSVSADETAVRRSHIKDRGRDFFEVACADDLEGIVAKPANGRYHGGRGEHELDQDQESRVHAVDGPVRAV
jgi:ATP-dependent DNA ligase